MHICCVWGGGGGGGFPHYLNLAPPKHQSDSVYIINSTISIYWCLFVLLSSPCTNDLTFCTDSPGKRKRRFSPCGAPPPFGPRSSKYVGWDRVKVKYLYI